MKKSVLTIVLLATLIFTLVGCGGGVPANMDQETYNLGNDALKIMEEYRNDKMDADEAEERLTEIADKLQKVKPKEEYEVMNSSVHTEVFAATVNIQQGDSVIDEIDSLKKTLELE